MEYRYFLVQSTFNFINVKKEVQSDTVISTEWAQDDGQAIAMQMAQLRRSRVFDLATHKAKARPMTGKETSDYKKKYILPKF